MAELLEQVVKDGSVRPDAIVATTFTIKAAAELQERVRTRLLGAGLATEAQQLSALRIGTVNSLCGGLLTDFAFELGISPDQKVIEEEAVGGVINCAMARVVDAKISRELWKLEQCFQEIDCRDNGTIVSGFIDLLLETENGFIIIDHKSFPGSVAEAKERAAGFAGQLRVYAEAVNEATGKEIAGCFIHLPLLGLIASVEISRASNTETAFI